MRHKTSVIDSRESQIVETSTETIMSKNPHEISLGKFLRARATHVCQGYQGYVMLSNGQVIKEAGRL